MRIDNSKMHILIPKKKPLRQRVPETFFRRLGKIIVRLGRVRQSHRWQDSRALAETFSLSRETRTKTENHRSADPKTV